MSDDQSVEETAARLRELIEHADLSEADRGIAEQCLRRLEQPLRLTVFGTDTRHAISLVNLMMGQSVISPSINRVRINFFYADEPYAKLHFRDGSRQRLDGSQFRRLFDDNPSWIRIYVNLPVLKKLSLLVASESNPRSLCADVEKTLPASDITLWAGDALTEPLANVWDRVPERLRDHSYLVLSPEMDSESWAPIAPEFVDLLQVDPRRAQEAKSAPNGVDKEGFKASGGALIVRTIKKEIDVLVQSALDGGEVLLMRHAKADAPRDEPNPILAQGDDDLDGWDDDDAETRPTLGSAQEDAELIARLAETVSRDPVYSVPLGKLASRSRLLGKSTSGPQVTQRTVSMAIKNMPRPTSKAPKRVRSRRSGPATPWSLGL